jgi:tetratricopeptide (TPR) repeat protein
MNHRVDTCPDLETIAAFIDARLDEPTREAIAAHLTTCDQCYFLLAEAAHVRPEAATPIPPRVVWWRRPAAGWSVATIAAAAALVLAVRMNSSTAPEDEALRELVIAVGNERLLETRLTGGFAYGPVRTARTGQTAIDPPSPELSSAAARIDEATSTQSSPAALHLRGKAALLVGDLSGAVTALQSAAEARPADAEVLNDLAVAYLERASRGADPNDLPSALAMLNRAVDADRLLPEARFNRAYVLQRLGMEAEARAAWEHYLALDNRSLWADEARLHLTNLTRSP